VIALEDSAEVDTEVTSEDDTEEFMGVKTSIGGENRIKKKKGMKTDPFTSKVDTEVTSEVLRKWGVRRPFF